MIATIQRPRHISMHSTENCHFQFDSPLRSLHYPKNREKRWLRLKKFYLDIRNERRENYDSHIAKYPIDQ